MDKSWFRFYNEFATDVKIQTMSEADQRRFVMLLCLENSGELCKMNDDQIAFFLRVTCDEWNVTRRHMTSQNLISTSQDCHIFVTNFKKRQFKSDSAAERTRRWREKKNTPSHDRHTTVTVTVPEPEPEPEQEKKEKEKEKEISSENISEASAQSENSENKNADPCPHQQIIELYHMVLPTLRKVKIWNKGRAAALRQRWLEDPNRQCLEFWSDFFDQVSKSDFLTGRCPGRDGPFHADLEWLLSPKHFVNVLEGKYKNRGKSNGTQGVYKQL